MPKVRLLDTNLIFDVKFENWERDSCNLFEAQGDFVVHINPDLKENKLPEDIFDILQKKQEILSGKHFIDILIDIIKSTSKGFPIGHKIDEDSLNDYPYDMHELIKEEQFIELKDGVTVKRGDPHDIYENLKKYSKEKHNTDIQISKSSFVGLYRYIENIQSELLKKNLN